MTAAEAEAKASELLKLATDRACREIRSIGQDDYPKMVNAAVALAIHAEAVWSAAYDACVCVECGCFAPEADAHGAKCSRLAVKP